MVNPQLIDYIKKVKQQGFLEGSIKEVLIKNGWQVTDIDLAFSEIQQEEMILNSGAPLAPGATLLEPQRTTTSTVIEDYNNSKLTDHNSPFSVGLAIVLLGSLIVLVNKIITDSSTITVNANGELIFDALIILPFLLVAFVLHGSFSRDNKRFLILSQPYFITAAFLLVRLLWDTSTYILNTNATYGVYVVLILVILSLTGIILFVQKYIKK
jgi:cytochrome c biogenesis factor